MKSNEFIVEAPKKRNWKDYANVGHSFMDNLMGTSSKGFDTTPKSEIEGKKQLKVLVTGLHEEWVKQVNDMYTGQPLNANALKTALVNLIATTLTDVDSTQYPYKPYIQKIIKFTLMDIANRGKTKLKDNANVYDGIQDIVMANFKELARGKESADSTVPTGPQQPDIQQSTSVEQTEHTAKFANINVSGKERYYFSFKGDISSYFRFDLIPDSEPATFIRGSRVTNSNVLKMIKRESPMPVTIKDISDDQNLTKIEFIK